MSMDLRRNLHLILSVLIVVPAAFLYGVYPEKTLSFLLDFQVNTTDLKSVFRALMGLYLSTAVVWLIGIFNTAYWKTATILNLVFMTGIGFGRLSALLVDGLPSTTFGYGIIGELLLAAFSYAQLRKYT